MTKHIVFFKFKAEVSENVRTSAFKAFKDGIERLPSEIPFIREVFVGRNCNEAEKWDVCLHSVFDNLEDTFINLSPRNTPHEITPNPLSQ